MFSIPGANAPVGVFLTYEFCKRRSKNPHEYGTGIPEGVAAPEAANNAVGGGAMIPLLTLGIPGDTVTAVLLGAFAIHGLSPGPMFFQLHPDLIYSIFMAFLIVVFLNYFIVSLSSSLLALAFGMMKRGFPVIPMILSMILGNMLEKNFRLSIILSGGNSFIFFKSPIALLFLTISLFLFISPFIRRWPTFLLWRYPLRMIKKLYPRRSKDG